MKPALLDTPEYKEDPTRASLAAVLRDTARIRIWDEGMCGNEPLGELLLEITEPDAITTLCGKLDIVDGPAGHCLCYGDVAIELLSRDNRRLALLGLHHGTLLRWNTWVEDATLADGRALLELLGGHGITEPLDRYEEARAEETEELEAWNRWVRAMPACLQELAEEDWRAVLEDNRSDAVRNSLAAKYSDAGSAILALLHWYGSNAGCWNGYPVYEDLPAVILSWYPAAQLIPAMENTVLTHTQLEGAARLCAGATFQNPATPGETARQLFPFTRYLEPSGQMVFIPQRRSGPANIPAGLRQRLLDHCLQSADADKRKRALTAFAA